VRRKASASFFEKKEAKKLFLMRGFSRAISNAPVELKFSLALPKKTPMPQRKSKKFFAELGVPMTRSFAAASESGRPIMIKKATACLLGSVPA